MDDNIIVKKADASKDEKSLNKNSFPIDINLMEVPLFLYQVNVEKTLPSVGDLLDSKISSEARTVLNNVSEDNLKSKVSLITWVDSKGYERSLLGMSLFHFPDGFCMSLYLALIKLFIEKNSPILFDKNKNKYLIEDRKVSFSIYELCEIMKIDSNGRNYTKIKNALSRLYKVDYYSLANGVFYDKENEQHTVNVTESIKLIEKIKEVNKKTRKSASDKWEVTIGINIISSIENNFVKFLNEAIFFNLKGDLTRRLYLYIEGNRYNGKGKSNAFMKRSFDILGRKIPLFFKYPSKFKEKIKTPLERLKEAGTIVDYFFADEIIVNGKAEKALYIIFEGSILSTIKRIEEKNALKIEAPKEEDKEAEKEEFIYPADINKELKTIGVSEDAIAEINGMFDKYTIVKYFLYIKQRMNLGKAKNPAALFIYAIRSGNVDLEFSAPEIIEFVDKYKMEVDKKNKVSENAINEAFEKYRNDQLDKFKEDDEAGYEMLVGPLINCKAQAIKTIKTLTAIVMSVTDSNERDKLLSQIENWEKIRDNGYSESEFKKKLFQEYIAYAMAMGETILDENAFRNKYISENK